MLITRATFLVATGIMSACYSPVLLADSAASTASTGIDDSDESGPATTTLSTSHGDSTSAGATAGTTSEASASGAMSDSSGEPTDGNTSFDREDCGNEVVNIPIVAPSVMLVLDKSRSMVADPFGFWDHDQDPNTATITRWNSLYTVLELIVNNYNNSMNVGTVLFPAKSAVNSYNETACVVGEGPDVPIKGMNAAALLAAIPGALSNKDTVQGAKPASKGLKVAITALEGAPAERPKFMIFVTDGAANCQENAPDTDTLFETYDEQLAATAAAAAAMGIKTYVVGIDISTEISGAVKDGVPDNTNSYEKLNELADAGGVPRPGAEKFFNATNQEELQAALEMISMQILDCTITLEPTPVHPEFVEVTPYGKAQVTDCIFEDGWMYLPRVDPNDMTEPLRIELCGQACADFQVSGKIESQYRCPDES
jgi:hypothetical protein